jgi:hypothetical protein
MDLGNRFMTEEKARHYAKILSRGMAVTFHAVRSRQGRFLAVQIPSDDCEILATIRPPRSANGSRRSRHEQLRRAAKRYRTRVDSTAAEMCPSSIAIASLSTDMSRSARPFAPHQSRLKRGRGPSLNSAKSAPQEYRPSAHSLPFG